MSPEHDFNADFCASDAHDAFGLSYASYLVVRRVLLQAMPPEWQHRLVTLMEEFNEAFPNGDGDFAVFLRGDDGKFTPDRLRNYRYPDFERIEAARHD